MRQARQALRGTDTVFLDRSLELSRQALRLSDEAAEAYEISAGKWEEADLSEGAARTWDAAADLRLEINKLLAKL